MNDSGKTEEPRRDPAIISADIRAHQTRFSSKKPLSTLLIQSIGPLMYNVGISLQDATDLFLISRAFGQSSIQIVGFSSIIRFLCMSFAIYFSQACIISVTHFIGDNKVSEAEKVIADLFRIAPFAMALISTAFYFIAKPLMLFMGCSDEISQKALEYLTPILISMPFISIFQLSNGFLQSQGRSVLAGAMQLSAFVLNCGVISPILLFVIKIPFSLAGLSFGISQSLPGIIVFILIIRGKFELKPNKSQWLSLPSKDAFNALQFALPFIINVLGNTLPPVYLLRCMMIKASAEGIAPLVGAAFPVYLRIESFVNSLSTGINQGFMASGSFASSTGNTARFRTLFILAFIITLSYHICWIYPMVAHSDVISSIWLTQSEEKSTAKKVVSIAFYTNFLVPINDVCINFLLACGKSGRALVPSLSRGFACLIGTFALYKAGISSSVQMMHVYNINDLTVLVADAAFASAPLMRTLKSAHLIDKAINNNPLLP